MWTAQSYPSGTHLVTENKPREPHLYVYGPDIENKYRNNLCTSMMCEELAGFLNGGEAPPWLNELERNDDNILVGCDGTRIIASGPYYDQAPPTYDWIECDEEEFKELRKSLIDKLLDC